MQPGTGRPGYVRHGVKLRVRPRSLRVCVMPQHSFAVGKIGRRYASSDTLQNKSSEACIANSSQNATYPDHYLWKSLSASSCDSLSLVHVSCEETRLCQHYSKCITMILLRLQPFTSVLSVTNLLQMVGALMTCGLPFIVISLISRSRAESSFPILSASYTHSSTFVLGLQCCQDEMRLRNALCKVFEEGHRLRIRTKNNSTKGITKICGGH